ncbi:MAG: hypothetical protein GY895_04605 [Phycisphaera sp.]|nr:hypothetical protein [Phycisphaera sp.]
MAPRHDITPGLGLFLSAVAAGGMLLAGGCSAPRSAPGGQGVDRVSPVRPVLVLPSPTMVELAALTDSELAIETGRRDRQLGGPPLATAGPGLSVVRVRDDQRIINGRVQSQTRWTTRAGDVRSRSR